MSLHHFPDAYWTTSGGSGKTRNYTTGGEMFRIVPGQT